jgi:hypothetical protein
MPQKIPALLGIVVLLFLSLSSALDLVAAASETIPPTPFSNGEQPEPQLRLVDQAEQAAAMSENDHRYAIHKNGKNPSSLAEIADCLPASSTIRPKVQVVTYNPWLSTVGTSLFEYESVFDPMTTAEQIRQDFCVASGGFVDIEIIGLIDRNEFPLEEDGKRMSETEYLQLRSLGLSYWHKHGVRVDIKATVEDLGLDVLVKNHQIDEVWLFGSWTYSMFEGYMGGPGAFFINGSTFDADSGRAFAVMGFENAVGVPNSLHSIGHRVESTLDLAFGHIQTNPDTPWALFRQNPSIPADWLPGVPMGVGDIHHPPNTSQDYDYTNLLEVQSTAEDWLNYPLLTGQTQLVNAHAWGDSDYGYYLWWYSHLPKADGVSPRADSAPTELRQNNWWKYIFQFTHYPELVGPENAEGQLRAYVPMVLNN